MGNLGLSFLESPKSALTHLRADIFRACSGKNFKRLKKLLKENKVVIMADEVETLLLTQDAVLECLRGVGDQASLSGQGKAQSWPQSGTSPHLKCACLILAVLLLQKLLWSKGVSPDSAIQRFIWSWSPHLLLPELLDKMLDAEGAMNSWLTWHRGSLRGEHDEEVAYFWITAAVLQFESLFYHEWTLPFSSNALYAPAHVVLSTITGNQAMLRQVFSLWDRSFFVKYVSVFLPFWLNLAQKFGKNNIVKSMGDFEKCYRQSRPSLQDFLSSILRLICGTEHDNPVNTLPRSDAKANLVCEYARFFFDAECVSDDALQNMDECPWTELRNFTVLINLEFIPESACRLCFAAFEKLCQRGCAGLFLMALQDEGALGEIPSTHRGSLILHLVEHQHFTPPRCPVLRSSCELCQHPIESFLVWMLSHPSLFDSCLDPNVIVPYCVDNGLPFFRRMKRSAIHNLCKMHEDSKPDPFALTFAIQACEAYKQGLSLSKSKHGSQTFDTKDASMLGQDLSIYIMHE